jgi:hypothetical protein
MTVSTHARVRIPPSVTNIAESCFGFCTPFASVIFERGCKVSVLGDKAFTCRSSLASICIAESVETIPSWCFGGCKNLLDSVVEPGVRILGEFAFESCASLRSIHVPPSIQTISADCFRSCIVTFKLGSDISVLGESAFEQCASLHLIQANLDPFINWDAWHVLFPRPPECFHFRIRTGMQNWCSWRLCL